MKKILVICLVIIGFVAAGFHLPVDRSTDYLSPTYICVNNQKQECYISLSTASQIAIVDLKKQQLQKRIDLPFNPGEIVPGPTGKNILVSDQLPEGSIHLISTDNQKVIKSIPVRHTPQSMIITPDKSRIFVCNRFSNSVSVIETDKYNVTGEIQVGREPGSIAVSPEGQSIAVADYLPDMAATDTLVAAKIHLIDQNNLEIAESITLTSGSQSVRDLVFSADGRYLYASHILSRNTLPTTQIEHGWINCNALSIIDVAKHELVTTVLLDRYDQGAANPAGMSLANNGTQLVIALSGVHELAFIDLDNLHQKLSNSSYEKKMNAPYDFKFLQGLIHTVTTQGKSPRHLASFEDQILATCYFSTGLEVFETYENTHQTQVINVGNEPKMTVERLGELYFSDADLCFQKWQSCISCHPNGRSDGLNWDLLNDGMGNPKNGKSMLFSHYTPPAMITGIREKAEVAVRAGIKYILFSELKEDQAACIDSYLKALEAVPSPFLENGKFSRSARKGKRVFEQAGCADCHHGEFFTDFHLYNVGTGIAMHRNDKFDVPTLKEVWRTAPYLYDGRAKTMKEVLTRFNQHDEHGKTSGLSSVELTQLAEYVLSL